MNSYGSDIGSHTNNPLKWKEFPSANYKLGFQIKQLPSMYKAEVNVGLSQLRSQNIFSTWLRPKPYNP